VKDGVVAPTHDLSRLREPVTLTADEPAPVWVEAALERAPWVVVRRGYVEDGRLPVGVRGTTRGQRFPAWAPAADIVERVSPEDLTGCGPVRGWRRQDEAPALAALVRVTPVLDCRGVPWGPAGSVGFELATGVETATASSDLDVILRQAVRMLKNEAVALLGALADAAAPARINVLLETPRGGVALADLATGLSRIVVRTPDGVRWMEDPWMLPAAA